MLGLSLPNRALTLLCLGAHPDDLEIGCGGTVLRLLEEHPGTTLWWVVLSGSGPRALEAAAGAAAIGAGAGACHIELRQFRDGYFPAAFGEVKDAVEAIRSIVPDPDVIFTHYRADRHQDHRVVSDVTWQTFRAHLILEYEVPKYDGDLGAPGLFVPLTTAQRDRKIEVLLNEFPTQHRRSWFTAETFAALMRLRGIECAAPAGHAEAFHVRKVVIGAG